MARSTRPTGPTPVESYRHPHDTRPNIPTADAAAEWMDEDDLDREPVEYARFAGLSAERAARNQALDPQLVWRGKDAQDDTDLVVDAPPIYIQEKIDPRVLIENLRKTATADQPEPEAVLFDYFDDLDGLDALEFYQHRMNWQNRMILGDSLQVMGSLAEREGLRGQVQMVYIDPPYGIKFGSNWQVSARKRDVRDGKVEDAAREAEQIKAFRDTWEDGIHTYLAYLRNRLVAARDLLTESGSVFVQIGDENVHLVRALLDEIFGSDNVVSQISFEKTSSSSMDYLDGVSDYVLWYAKDYGRVKYRALFRLKPERSMRFLELADGSRRPATAAERSGDSLPPVGARWYEVGDITSQTDSSQARYTLTFDGQDFPAGKRNWATPLVGMTRAINARRVERRASSVGFVRFADDFPAIPLRNNWSDTGTGSFTDSKVYVVQTGTKVIERCMLMATDPGDLVVDPTCGSGTTAYVAEHWGRRWITMDTSRVALALARQRLMGGKYPYYVLADSDEGRKQEGIASGKVLPPATTEGDIRQGFVYERVQHVTLKSIANNPDIREGMTRDEIDAAIKRHAEFELLYDRPYEDKRRVRVTGPFTVESLSPYRSLSFGEETAGSGRAAETDASGADFASTVLDSLRASGIQNGRRDERIEFSSLDPFAGNYVQMIGERRSEVEDTAPAHVAIALGPQYGTVSAAFVKDAVREIKDDTGVDLLCVLGFSFDPNVTSVTEADGVTLDTSDAGFAQVAGERKLGRIKVLLVRMNAELLMGDALKKTGAGNLFTVFGEPDIQVRTLDDGRHEIELHGVDVYDPTIGKVRSRQTDRVALWMIDTDYDGESFYVRQCFFTGGNDPMKKLERALKSDIDPDAWAALHRTVSLPFDRPSTGRVAVKVINDYGDEVMKVYDVE